MLLQSRKTSGCFVATLLKWRLYSPAHGHQPVVAKIKLHSARKNCLRHSQWDVVAVGWAGGMGEGCGVLLSTRAQALCGVLCAVM